MQYLLRNYGSLVCSGNWQVADVTDFCRLYYIRGGRAAYEDCRGIVALQAGTLYLFPAYMPYTIQHDPACPLDVLWFHANLFTVHLDRPLAIPVIPGSLQEHLVQALSHCQATPPALVDKLFDALCDSLGLHAGLPESGLAAMQQVFDMICQQDGTVPCNKEMAARLGYSEKYFIRLFFKTAGQQPHKFAIQVRMAKAARYLCSGESVSETASRLGYSSVNNFSRDFKAFYGKSPRRYVAGTVFLP